MDIPDESDESDHDQSGHQEDGQEQDLAAATLMGFLGTLSSSSRQGELQPQQPAGGLDMPHNGVAESEAHAAEASKPSRPPKPSGSHLGFNTQAELQRNDDRVYQGSAGSRWPFVGAKRGLEQHHASPVQQHRRTTAGDVSDSHAAAAARLSGVHSYPSLPQLSQHHVRRTSSVGASVSGRQGAGVSHDNNPSTLPGSHGGNARGAAGGSARGGNTMRQHHGMNIEADSDGDGNVGYLHTASPAREQRAAAGTARTASTAGGGASVTPPRGGGEGGPSTSGGNGAGRGGGGVAGNLDSGKSAPYLGVRKRPSGKYAAEIRDAGECCMTDEYVVYW